jgi:hypothetical protein
MALLGRMLASWSGKAAERTMAVHAHCVAAWYVQRDGGGAAGPKGVEVVHLLARVVAATGARACVVEHAPGDPIVGAVLGLHLPGYLPCDRNLAVALGRGTEVRGAGTSGNLGACVGVARADAVAHVARVRNAVMVNICKCVADGYGCTPFEYVQMQILTTVV